MNRRPGTISTLFFIPLPPSNLRPFGAPPSIGRRECPREPLPLEGAAEPSEAGLVSFCGGEAASSLSSPLRKEDRVIDARVLSYNGALETIFSTCFSHRFPHPTSAPSGHLLPMEGGSVHASPFHRKGLPSAARRGWLPFGAALGCSR